MHLETATEYCSRESYSRCLRTAKEFRGYKRSSAIVFSGREKVSRLQNLNTVKLLEVCRVVC